MRVPSGSTVYFKIETSDTLKCGLTTALFLGVHFGAEEAKWEAAARSMWSAISAEDDEASAQ